MTTTTTRRRRIRRAKDRRQQSVLIIDATRRGHDTGMYSLFRRDAGINLKAMNECRKKKIRWENESEGSEEWATLHDVQADYRRCRPVYLSHRLVGASIIIIITFWYGTAGTNGKRKTYTFCAWRKKNGQRQSHPPTHTPAISWKAVKKQFLRTRIREYRHRWWWCVTWFTWVGCANSGSAGWSILFLLLSFFFCPPLHLLSFEWQIRESLLSPKKREEKWERSSERADREITLFLFCRPNGDDGDGCCWSAAVERSSRVCENRIE